MSHSPAHTRRAREGLTLRPAQINFHMQSTGRLEVHPEVRLLLLVTCYQILKLYCGIGIEVIIDWCCERENYYFPIGKALSIARLTFVEHGDA